MIVAHGEFGGFFGDARPPIDEERSSCAKETSPMVGMSANVVNPGHGASTEVRRRRQAGGALMKTGQAAEYLAISVRQLQYLSERQEVAVIQMGKGCVRYDRADLDDYIDRRRRPCRKEAAHG